MNKIKRIYVEKKPEFAVEANMLLEELKNFLGIKKLKSIRIIHRYDIEGANDEIYKKAKTIVFSDSLVDLIYDEKLVIDKEDKFFTTEYLPGQYDQKADFAAQCLQILALEERAKVKTAQLIILQGNISDDEFEKIKNYYINPVEIREAAIEKPETLVDNPVIPDKVEVLNNFIDEENVEPFLNTLGLAMTKEDLEFCQDYFKNIEKRNPTITEIRVIDTYWSDHCRHTTFNTIIDKVEIEGSKYKDDIEKAFEDYKNARKYVYQDKTKEMCLMDIAQIAMKEMRKRGSLEDLEVS
ncbi:MAG: phosphoribosylformylglycinamidine synthase, partial [Firmicutes bacterium]|nr:phosphoribosylformylglycinamidine synthase [Bacillota bacterium]